MKNNDRDFIVQKIRSQYIEKEPGPLEELKALDSKAKKGARVFAYVFGVISAIIMGAGMSLVMTDLGEFLSIAAAMPIGIAVGVIGLAMALINYPIYKRMLERGMNKYADRIVALSDELMNK